jgi:DNA-directed RNA polymerase subunit F
MEPVAYVQTNEGWIVAMSNINWDDEDDDNLDTDYSSALGDDNDLLKKLRKAKRSDEKRIKELTEQLETFSKVQNERTVKEILEQKGVNPKAARLILKDLGNDVSPEAVNNWLDTDGDLVGFSRQEEAPPATEMDRAALRQQDIVTQNAITPTQAMDAFARINDAQSAEEIIAMIHNS